MNLYDKLAVAASALKKACVQAEAKHDTEMVDASSKALSAISASPGTFSVTLNGFMKHEHALDFARWYQERGYAHYLASLHEDDSEVDAHAIYVKKDRQTNTGYFYDTHPDGVYLELKK